MGTPGRESQMPDEQQGDVYAGLVQVRITLDHLKQTVEHAISEHALNIEATARYELEQALKKFDLAAAIRCEIQGQVGLRMHELVCRYVDEAIQERLEKPEMKTVAHEAILDWLGRHAK